MKMIRKPVNCAIKLPDTSSNVDTVCNDGSTDADSSFKKRLQLVNFGHSQWGQNNWSWSVTKQDVDFTDYSNGKYTAGVAAFVTVSVNTLGIQRADVGYATSTASQKGSAIHRARKSSITNALRETLFSFGGNIAVSLNELLEANTNDEQSASVRSESEESKPETNNKPIPNLEEPKSVNTKTLPLQIQRSDTHQKETKKNGNPRSPLPFLKAVQQPPMNSYPQQIPEKSVNPSNQTSLPSNKQAVGGPPANQTTVKAQPITSHPPPLSSASLPPPPISRPPSGSVPSLKRPDSNVSLVFQPVGVMPGMMQSVYSMRYAGSPHSTPPSRMPPTAQIYPNAYFAEYAPLHLTYDNERHHNLPKNLVINGQSGIVEFKNVYSMGKPAVNGNTLKIDPMYVHRSYMNHQANARWILDRTEN